MQTCISFLRGVNMAGHNKIRMTELAVLYKKIGFNDAETFIQSGNVIFSNSANLPLDQITAKIEDGISKQFGYDIPALVRTSNNLKEIISANPYAGEESFDTTKLAVIFLYKVPDESQIQKIRGVDYPPDKFMIKGKEIYIYCPNGFGKTKLYTNFFENRMKVTGTARNWNTLNTIFELALSKKYDPHKK